MLDGLTGFGLFAVSAMPLDDPSRENIPALPARARPAE
jgi:hypothetical protein